MTPGIQLAATALLTYAAHSTIACLLAVGAKLVVRRPQDRDLMWKAALVAPLVTTAIAVLLSIRATDPASVDISFLIRRLVHLELPGRKIIVLMTRGPGGANMTRTVTDPVAAAVAYAVVSVVALCMTIGFGRMLARRIALARLLRSRRATSNPSATWNRGVFLSTSNELHTPVALGRREICLPTEVAESFSEAHRDALIAHETAHLDRRDPLWFAAVDAIAALSAFQPLVFAVTRAFRRDVELICDEAAVRHTGDRAALLGALALLASPFDPRSPLAAVASAHDGSPLITRARRIADLDPVGPSPRPRAGFTLAVVAATLAVLAAVPVLAPLSKADHRAPGMVERREDIRIEQRSSSADEEQADVHRVLRVIQ